MELKLPIIRSKERFLKEIKVGDEFWSIRSMYTRPVSLAHYRFKAFKEGAEDHWIIIDDLNSRYSSEASINDLTNYAHGCFTNRREAEAALVAAKEQFQNDPEWQERARKAKEELDLFLRELVESSYDD